MTVQVDGHWGEMLCPRGQLLLSYATNHSMYDIRALDTIDPFEWFNYPEEPYFERVERRSIHIHQGWISVAHHARAAHPNFNPLFIYVSVTIPPHLLLMSRPECIHRFHPLYSTPPFGNSHTTVSCVLHIVRAWKQVLPPQLCTVIHQAWSNHR